MKRVYCLYRVSTKGQVDKDDIPMQKTSCRDFAQRNGWTILKEFQEKGVSGFKVSASDECGLIGEGTHERFVINTDKFMARTEAKLK